MEPYLPVIYKHWHICPHKSSTNHDIIEKTLFNRKKLMPLLQRTIKLTLATCLAAALAAFLGLSNAISAGIIAILSVSDTRRSTIKLARNRLLSTYLFGWEIGITPSTVLVTHLLLAHSVSWSLLANEMAVFLIGTGFALLANLYMASNQQDIDNYHIQVEEQLKKILLRFEYFLKAGDGRNDAALIKELDTILQEALELVYLDHSNHLFHQTNYHIHYFEMRQAQNRILEDMAGNINNCQLAASESLILARLFSKTAQQLSQENPAHELVEEIEACLAVFRERPLPKTRQEFETRATLLQLLRDLETFIKIKVEFYQNYQKVQAN